MRCQQRNIVYIITFFHHSPVIQTESSKFGSPELLRATCSHCYYCWTIAVLHCDDYVRSTSLSKTEWCWIRTRTGYLFRCFPLVVFSNGQRRWYPRRRVRISLPLPSYGRIKHRRCTVSMKWTSKSLPRGVHLSVSIDLDEYLIVFFFVLWILVEIKL